MLTAPLGILGRGPQSIATWDRIKVHDTLSLKVFGINKVKAKNAEVKTSIASACTMGTYTHIITIYDLYA